MAQQHIDDKALLAHLEAQLEAKRVALGTLQAQVLALESGIEKVRLGLGLVPVTAALPLAPPITAPAPSGLAVTLLDGAAKLAGAVALTGGKAFRNMELGNAIKMYLTLTRSLQTTGQIVRGLHDGGFRSDAKKFSKSVSQALVRMWRESKVQRTADNLWGLPEWPRVEGHVYTDPSDRAAA